MTAETDGRAAEQELHAERLALHGEGDALTSLILRALPSESGQDELERISNREGGRTARTVNFFAQSIKRMYS